MIKEKSRPTAPTIEPAKIVSNIVYCVKQGKDTSFSENTKPKFKCDDLDFDPETDFLLWDKHPDVAESYSTLNSIYRTRENPLLRRSMAAAILKAHYFTGQLLQQQNQLYSEIQYLKTTIAQLRDIVQEYAHDTGTEPEIMIAFLRNKALTEKAIADTNKLMEKGK